MRRTAGCACGQLILTCTGDPIRVSICHCHACKRLSGSAFSWNARWESAQVTITGSYREWRRTGDEGTTITNSFCPDCGTTVFYGLGDAEGQIAVRAGCFADETLPPPSVSVYDPARRVDWLHIDAPGLTRTG
ncbi:GFA family protein [Wenxinia saemankumensis]|uniref:Uncharacterized conserved protein n=1 Tax=Wenxinia saemankumensis TaxID=1447782 RepID=A0A1M6ECN8_9RHOB|nr:GFA family protein [Wenxinia saemankumensis]SHI83193.1 Uncharacterized conserved protein [Wenxinia saemankumensis]